MQSSEDTPATPRLATRFLRLALRRAARGTGSQSAFYLIKLQAVRTQDLADLQRLLALTPPSEHHEVREVGARDDPALLEDREALITLADLEFGLPPAATSSQTPDSEPGDAASPGSAHQR